MLGYTVGLSPSVGDEAAEGSLSPWPHGTHGLLVLQKLHCNSSALQGIPLI